MMRVTGVSVRVGYWRKANAIHGWFVRNVQGGKDECQDSSVSRESLKELRNLCQKMLDEQLVGAADCLPTKPGFFFGTYEYDDHYRSDLEDMIKIVNLALAMPDEWDFEYHFSW